MAKSNSNSNTNSDIKVSNWEVVIASAELQFHEIASIDNNIVSFAKEAKYALQIIQASESSFRNCTTESIRNAIVNVAACGLTLNPAMKLAYLVPRKGVCCLDISYIGLTQIAVESGSVLAVKAEIVRTNDPFEYNGPFKAPTHKFNPLDTNDSRGQIKGSYAMAQLANGAMVVDVLNNEEITKIRSLSKANSGPWFDWFEEMVKKSAIKRNLKSCPRCERLSRVEKIINDQEGNELDITPAADSPRALARPNAAMIAEATQTVQRTAEGDRLIADLEAVARTSGRDVFINTWKALPHAKRALVGISNRDRITEMGV